MGGSSVRNVGILLAFSLAMATTTTGCKVEVSSLGPSGASSPPSSGLLMAEDGGSVANEIGPSSGGGCVGGSLQQPTFPGCTASTPQPPISGGTILITKDGLTAIISDPDRDAIYIVNLTKGTVSFTVALQAGDEPGRLTEDAAGRIHVALRSGGALVTIDPTTGAVVTRRSVCPAPRGVAYDSTRDAVWVACATGELVALPAAGGVATTSWVLERDLRDVLVTAAGALSVSEFRSAQLLNVGSNGSIATRLQMPAPDGSFTPHVAWRTVPGPSGTTVCVHQEHSQSSINTTTTGGYGGGCGGPTGVLALPLDAGLAAFDDGGIAAFSLPPSSASAGPMGSVLTIFGSDGTVQLNRTFNGVLPVDVAVSPDGSNVAVACPGSSFTQSGAFVLSQGGQGEQTALNFSDFTQVPIAVAFDLAGNVLVQTRDPATLWTFPAGSGEAGSGEGGGPSPVSIPLSTVSSCDTGHDIFHTHAGVAIACASCHPEGGDDGHVWLLNEEQRRTPSLRGTIAGTAPYHWPGDEANLPTLVNDVYTVRMAGSSLNDDEMSALTGWVQTIPPPPAPTWVDAASAAAGQVIFQSSAAGCSTCHSGSKFTNNQTLDVGTGGAFQVPPLIGVGWRTPLLHDGCAQTIADRFGACSTSQHGSIASLTATDLLNLEAYLETL